ncbi:hypothetical protein BDQ17DRAFT_1298352 [Cyathus striatus]|nr:hypothetical protein BDQ17DRAFT_1298352 [Cyathus striatus]
MKLSAFALIPHVATLIRTSPVGLLDQAFIFDSPAFPDPANPGATIAQIQSFVALRQLDLDVVSVAISSLLNSLGIDVGNRLTTLQERAKLFAAVGLSNQEVKLSVDGCTKKVKLQDTSGLPDLGMVTQNVSLGTCEGAKESTAKAILTLLDNRVFTGTIFISPDSGFGVISDIDDTIKITNVLSTAGELEETFLNEPKPVPGMPELYASLATSLSDPQFIYVTGSPFQLYPFLNFFVDTTYSASKGPIFTQNFTFADIPSLINLLKDSNAILQGYKEGMIDRIRGMYPHKKFLTVGDSTQRDPEVYADAYVKYGPSTVACIWIRAVNGSNNRDARFAAAFAGVPNTRYRVFTDEEIPSLRSVNIAGGAC